MPYVARLRFQPLLRAACVLLAATGASATASAAEEWSWAQQQARPLPQGDLEWTPRDFVFVAGETVRYIDYEQGDDGGAGTREDPWQHHPWDARADGAAAAHGGPTTYVFKRGVTYRGELEADESGTAGEPIRLTSDPSWGEGEARFYGSRRITGGWQPGAHPDMPESAGVWHIDLTCTPRHVWLVAGDGATATPLTLARTPNWDPMADPRAPVAEWFTWENPRWWEGDPVHTTVDGRDMHLGVDTQNLTRDADYYVGGLVWTEWGTMMGMPYAAEIQAYDPERKAIAYEGPWHRRSGTIRTGHRYYLEDKPHYLDEDGEFWFDRQGSGGRLYLRLPDGGDPNQVVLEVADVINFIDGENVEHVEVSGLAFRFGDVHYDLAARHWEHEDVKSAVVRFSGGSHLAVRNCVFEHVSNAVQVLVDDGADFEDLTVADNLIRWTDHHGVNFRCGGTAHGLRVMRNRLHENGFRGIRPKDNFTINLGTVHTAEIAGNIITRSYAAGINVSAGQPGKVAGGGRSSPLVRVLIHHNEVVDSMLTANDWGGIETWQSGPYYIYNNISTNPVGPFHDRTFGFAYYMDGSFKNYLFNNIAVGDHNDPERELPNYAAFQAIHSYQNTLFNNTAFRFQFGTRRQAPQAGRDKYLANVFQDISSNVFRHSDAKNTDPNAQDAGAQRRDFAYHTNAYADNVLHDIGGVIGSFHELGGEYEDFDAFVAALAEVQPMAHEVGVLADTAPLRDPANGDFRPTPGGPAIDRGARVFVPWGLYAVVGEWNFTTDREDPTRIIDEHFFLTGYHVSRDDYYQRPLYPLRGHGIDADDFVAGPLEDWTTGALRLDGEAQYCAIAHATLAAPYTYQVEVGERGDKCTEERTAGREELQSPDIHDSDFLIEAYLRVENGDTGVLVHKRDAEAGYALSVADDGRLRLAIRQGGADVAHRLSAATIADGEWHHVVAEVERGAADGLRLYVDGSLANGAGSGAAPVGSLLNDGDFLVGGGPELDHLACTIDFLRVARGTLAEARTTIEELHAWQLDGPQWRDFTGAEPTGERRDAGAIESR